MTSLGVVFVGLGCIVLLLGVIGVVSTAHVVRQIENTEDTDDPFQS